MGRADAMKAATQHLIRLSGREVSYRLLISTAGRKLRIRVGPEGVTVVKPRERTCDEVKDFLIDHQRWILDQVDRLQRLRGLRRPEEKVVGEILLRGQPTRVLLKRVNTRARGNHTRLEGNEIVVQTGENSRTPPARSLELWLRRQARSVIESHLAVLTPQLGQEPNRIYVMGQRTKWGNCSHKRNLSFNWRLVLAPDFVIQYLVTHEVTHLAIPDHSSRFWLTVQSLCPEAERARQWLVRNLPRLNVDLDDALGGFE